MSGETSVEKETVSPRRRRWRWAMGLAILLGGLWFVVTDAYREEEKELRKQLREAVKETFPEEAAAFSQGFGLLRFEPDSEGHTVSASDRGFVQERTSD